MQHSRELFKIKKRVRYYDKLSFGQELDRYLSRYPDGSIEKHQCMPSLVYLLYEWLLEVPNEGTPRKTNSHDISWFMNRLWQLSDKLGGNRQTESVTLFLRPMINNQFWTQHPSTYWLRALILQYALMIPKGISPFNDEFFQTTKVQLSDYFIIAALVLFGMDNERRFMKYHDLVSALNPHFSIDVIARALRLFAMFPEEMTVFLRKKMPQKISINIINADTRLLHSPVILESQGLYTPDYALLRRGLSESALNHFLRLNRSGFRARFGKAYENYIRGCLVRDDITFDSEEDIKQLYKANKVDGKVIDALVKAKSGVVFIEAKGVVPKVETLITADPRQIKHHLKDTVLKAAKQIIECAYKLDNECNQHLPERDKRYGLIVTQGEYYLKRFFDIAKYIAGDTISKLESKFGQPIPYRNIFICNINDFDYLNSTGESCDDFLVSFMHHCKEEEKNSSTSKMLMLQHIDTFFQKLESRKKNADREQETAVKDESLLTDLASIAVANAEYWKSKSKTELINKSKELKVALTGIEPDPLKM